ncbi:MAG: flagellar biosynthetic protein FliO [Pirellulaceae bacterium]
MNTSATRLKARRATLAIGLMWMGIDAAFAQTKLPPVHSAYGPTTAPHGPTMANYDLDVDSLIRERHMEPLRTELSSGGEPTSSLPIDRGSHNYQRSQPHASRINEQYAQPLHTTREPLPPASSANNSSHHSRPPQHSTNEAAANELADPELSGRVYSQVGRVTQTDLWNPKPWSHPGSVPAVNPAALSSDATRPTNGEFATRQAVLQSRPGEDQSRVSPVYANVPVQDSSPTGADYVEAQRQREIELRTREIEQQLYSANASFTNLPDSARNSDASRQSVESSNDRYTDTSTQSSTHSNIDVSQDHRHEPIPSYRDTDLTYPSDTPQTNPLRTEKAVVAEPEMVRQENAIIAPPVVDSVAGNGVAAKEVVASVAGAETALAISQPSRSHESLVYQSPEPPEPPQLAAMISRLVLGTATVLGVCIVSLLVAKRWMPTNVISDRPAPTMRVVGSLALPNKSFLQLVEVDERRMVVGGNPGGVQTIVPLAESFRDQWSPDDEEEAVPDPTPHRELRDHRKPRREEEPRATATTRNALPELIVVKSTERGVRKPASSHQEDVVSAKVSPAATHQFLRAMLSDT